MRQARSKRQRGRQEGGGNQRQLGAEKSRGAEATQRQYTELNDNRDSRLNCRDQTVAPASITEGVEIVNTPRRRGVLRAATRHGATKLGLHLAEQWSSWIGHGLQSGPTLTFLLWLSDFKIKTSFGFPIKKSEVFFVFFRTVEK